MSEQVSLMSMSLEQHVSALSCALTGDQRSGDRDILNAIDSGSRIAPGLALDIYRNNTRGARVKALEMIFPACRSILGDDTFRSIAHDYVAGDSAGTADLNRYGNRFASSLGSLVGLGRLSGDYAYLHDLACLEFMYHAAYYADDDPAFDFESFERKLAGDEPVRFRLSASLGLLASRYPVYRIWQLNSQGASTAENGSCGVDVDAVDGMQYLLVCRETGVALVVQLDCCEYSLLRAFGRNRSLQSVIGRMDCRVDVLLPGLIARRWIVGIRHDA